MVKLQAHQRKISKEWVVSVTPHSPTILDRFDVEYINIRTKKVLSGGNYLTIREVNKSVKTAKKELKKRGYL